MRRRRDTAGAAEPRSWDLSSAQISALPGPFSSARSSLVQQSERLSIETLATRPRPALPSGSGVASEAERLDRRLVVVWWPFGEVRGPTPGRALERGRLPVPTCGGSRLEVGSVGTGRLAGRRGCRGAGPPLAWAALRLLQHTLCYEMNSAGSQRRRFKQQQGWPAALSTRHAWVFCEDDEQQ